MESAQNLERGWWERWWAVALLMGIAALPFVALPYAPFPDVLGHIGRYSIQLHLTDSPTLGQYYEYEFAWIGNIGVDFFVHAFGEKAGILPIVKWIAVAIPPITILGFALIAKQLTGSIPPTIGFASVLAFSFPFMLGFLNFALSMALALNAFALWVWLDHRQKIALRALIFLPLAPVIYFTHTFGWGILGLMVFGFALSKRRGLEKITLRSIISAGLETFPLWLAFFQIVLWRTAMDGAETDFALSIDRKVSSLITALRDRSFLLDIAVTAPVFLLLIQAARKDDFDFDRRILAIFGPLFVVFLLMPGKVFGSAFADARMAPYVLALALLGVLTKKAPSVVAVVGFALLTLRALTVGVGAFDGAKMIAHNAAIFDELPAGSRILQINGNVCPDWEISRLQMLSSFHILENEGFSNATWDMGGANPLRITYDLPEVFRDDPVAAASSLGCGDAKKQRILELYQKYPSNKFDYVLIVEQPEWMDKFIAQKPIRETPLAVLYSAR